MTTGRAVTTTRMTRRLRVSGGKVLSWLLRTSSLRSTRMTRGEWGYLIAVFALSRSMIFILGLIGTVMFPNLQPNQTWLLQPITWRNLSQWSRVYKRFDSSWYIAISAGYPSPIPGNLESLRIWGFLPGYPIALHLVARALLFLRVPEPVGTLAGVIVSFVALFGAVIYLYRLAAAELNGLAARRAITYLLVFPASLFLSAVYPEGLLLFATVGAFYHARRRQWLAAGLLAAVAAITHSEGVLLLAPLTLEFLAYYWGQGGWRQWRMLKLGWLLAPPLLTLGAYALYSHSRTGYWLAFSTSQSLVWGHRLALPISPFIGFLLRPAIGSAFDFEFSLLNIAAAFLALLLCVTAFRRLPPTYGVWLLLSILLPLSTDGSHTHAIVRYLSTLFPLFVALAAWSVGARWHATPSPSALSAPSRGVARDETPLSPAALEMRDHMALIPSILLLALYTLMFTAGIYAAI